MSSERPLAAPLPLRVLLLGALLAAPGCTRPGEAPVPRPSAITPARGVNLAPVRVLVEGEDFLPVGVQRLGGTPPVERDARFRLFLDEVALEDVQWQDAQHLTATVPPGLPAGLHALRVVSPLGAEGRLPGAFLAVAEPFARLEGTPALERAQVAVGQRVAVVWEVRNTGESAARAVQPTLHAPASVEVAEAPGAQDVPAGGSVRFSWSVVPSAAGQVDLSVEARGVDAESGVPVALGPLPVPTLRVRLSEVEALADDPFGDGTSFSFVFGYRGALYLGPSRNGRGGVRMAPDGSGAQSFAFVLPADVTNGGNGRTTSNTAAGPYPSIGATGCAHDTLDCGPDNEDGRALFFAGTAAGSEWLGIAGTRSLASWDYFYLTRDTDAVLDFSYVDVSATAIGGQAASVSSARFFGDRLYLGIPDWGGSRPSLLVLKAFPTAPPGLEAVNGTQAESLDADAMPWVGKNGVPANPAPAPQMVDALMDFNGRLYLANNGGCMRTTVQQPRPYRTAPADWASCTPPASLAPWSGLTALSPTRVADLTPADKAVPQLAVFAGRLYLARNTTAGPQLWVCSPATRAPAEDCDPEDWTLVAPNGTGDARLTQFDDADNARLTLLVATSHHLYVGFDNAARGAVLFRTAAAAASAREDFQGWGGCSAALGPGACEGLGGNGLGAGLTRLFDGLALTSGGAEALYLTAGTGSGPVQVLRIVE